MPASCMEKCIQRAHLWTLARSWMCRHWVGHLVIILTSSSVCNLSVSGPYAEMFRPLLRKRHSPRGVFSKAASCVCAELCTAIDSPGRGFRGAQPEVWAWNFKNWWERKKSSLAAVTVFSVLSILVNVWALGILQEFYCRKQLPISLD